MRDPHEIEIYAALGRLFRAITLDSRTDENTGGLWNPDDGVPRGVKLPRPAWLTVDCAEIPPISTPPEEREIYQELRDYSWDRRGVSKWCK